MSKRRTGGFFQRGHVWWTRLEGRQVSTGCRDLGAAQKWRIEQERRLHDPNYSAEATTTLAVAIGDYMREIRVARRSADTLEYYTRKLGTALRIFRDACGYPEEPASGAPDVLLRDLTSAVGGKYVELRLAEDVQPSTVRKELSAIMSVLASARHAGKFAREPSSIVPRLFEAPYKPRSRFVRDLAELEAVLAGLAPHRAAWVRFAIATGARYSEVVRAQRGDVDKQAGVVRIRGTKTQTSARTIPIVSTMAPLLDRALRDADGKGAELFSLYARSNVCRDLHRAAEKAGVEPLSPNDLRRTFASWLVQAGVAPNLVAYLLGHKSSAMVERVYGRLTPETASLQIEAVLQAKRRR